MLREALLRLSRAEAVKRVITGFAPTDRLVHAFVAGDRLEDALAGTRRLLQTGRAVTIDHLGEDTTDPRVAEEHTGAYLELLDQLREHALSRGTEVSIKLSALGQRLPGGSRPALERARLICTAARNAGTTVTVDMEEHTCTDDTLAIVRQLRQDFPDVGAVVQACLRRSEADCGELAVPGSRIRLVKGAYAEPDAVAWTDRAAIDRAYVRCLRLLINGAGYPMIATHDRRLIAIAEELARRAGRGPGDLEFQMLYGIGVPEQQRLLAAGHTVRVYLPYGTEWYGYLVRRLAERPANLALVARGLVRR